MDKVVYLIFVTKNMLAARPMPATTNDMILYYQNLSDIRANIITPIPKTKKLDIKVNVFLKLLSLSFHYY